MTIDDLALPGFDLTPPEHFHIDPDGEILPDPERLVVLEDDGYERSES